MPAVALAVYGGSKLLKPMEEQWSKNTERLKGITPTKRDQP